MSQVPGLEHVTSTLFHSPLVGVDKETIATSMTCPLINKISGSEVDDSEVDEERKRLYPPPHLGFREKKKKK